MKILSILVPVYGSKKTELETFLKQVSLGADDLTIYFVYESETCEFDFEKWVISRAAKLGLSVDILTLSGRKGLGYALQKGLVFCETEYVMRHDIGDDFLPNRPQLVKDAIRLNPGTDILYSQALLQKGNVESKSNYPLSIRKLKWALIFRNPICHPTVVLKKASIEGIGNYCKKLRYCEDLDLWMRSVKAGLNFHCINYPTIRYYSPAITRSNENWKVNLKVRFRNLSSPNFLYGVLGILLVAIYLSQSQAIKRKIYDIVKSKD